ncbi:MAG: hypothetical protein A2534_00505 [Candidatus Magasanikbacteria bacterium RIFOXYD2_FULL_39_9]|uniref:Uncharacterized protein n=1 Tax=Candidatus Magasanikbacteria bacterium RIFOXYD1_FULL_40_23 TaxID=1798705 RepID=A0A1F6PAI8_9BACT|nr:MAG: hypothetical protein A2534_00505 [Candidatus Magasanikbacteria bacterium RIFOXYD2_FULL_39_9]OGH93050.1 MAG: hypothetical protein A2563_04710 [Candidatus Magasanikbacteria bacterium RIFOXYD1_FULL_40_23]
MSRASKIVLFFIVTFSVFFNTAYVFAQTESKFIPDCVLRNPTGINRGADEGECRSISIYVILLLNVANYLFGIVGALALLFFIYGGFTLIISRGNSEQTKKGIEIITAAVIGLVIVFGAYMLVQFLGKAVGLKGPFMLN